LLISAVISLLIPFAKFEFAQTVSQNSISYLLDTVEFADNKIENLLPVHFQLSNILLYIYLIGVTFYTTKFLYQFYRIYKMISKFQVVKSNGLKLVFTNSEYLNFSFFNIIFLNNSDTKSEDAQKILSHELVHVNQKHTIDAIFIEVLSIIIWFNPIIYLYKNSIKEVHEYLADDNVIKNSNMYSYQELLLSKVVGTQFNLLTNFFNKSLIKRRIIMMTKPRSSSLAKFKVFFAIPMIFMLMLAFSTAPKKAYSQEKQEKIVLKSESKQSKGNEVYTKVDVMPEFSGGAKALRKFIATNVVYPEIARKKGIVGKVYVKFVVDKNGNITKVKISRGVNEIIDREALRVINSMPKWKPGKQNGKAVDVEFTIPIDFKLSDKEK
jgi:TonB family protein